MAVDLISVNEPERLAAVRRYDILDTPPDGAFERITALAARLLNVPISIVSIVDRDRIWFKSHHGLEVEQIDRQPGLCASAILQDGPWLVADAASDPRTLTNPLVAGDFGLRFYAGVPLTTHDGYNLGTLCVIDHEPRAISEDEVATLTDLATLVMDELELRLSARTTVGLEAELRRQAESIARTLQESLLPPELPSVPSLELDARYHVAYADQVGGDFYDVIPSSDGDGCALVIGDACGKGTRAAALTGTARWTLRTVALRDWTPSDALARLNDVLVRAHDDPERYVTVALARVLPAAGGGGGVDVTLALGGHPQPLVLRAADGAVEAIGVTSPIVGWRSDTPFVDSVAHLASGDVLVLFTDGMLEAVAGHGESDDELVRAVLRPLAGRSASEVADALDVALGVGLDDTPMRDDAAFLVARVR
jgi:sigma-B regulation protein RsbU (phosphoserine phosphatase)